MSVTPPMPIPSKPKSVAGDYHSVPLRRSNGFSPTGPLPIPKPASYQNNRDIVRSIQKNSPPGGNDKDEDFRLETPPIPMFQGSNKKEGPLKLSISPFRDTGLAPRSFSPTLGVHISPATSNSPTIDIGLVIKQIETEQHRTVALDQFYYDDDEI